MSRILPPGNNQDYGDNVLPAPQVGTGGGTPSPLTTKGDVYTYDTTNQRLPIGPNGYVLTADSTATTGNAWKPTANSNINQTALGLKKRWRWAGGLDGASLQFLPASGPYTLITPSITAQPPDWTSNWMSLGKSLIVGNGPAGSPVLIAGVNKEFALSTKPGSGFFYVARVGWHTRTATQRAFFGMTANNAAFAADPSSKLNIVGIGCDAADTQFTAMHNDGVGTATKDVINGGAGFPCNTNQADFYEFGIFAAAKQTTTVSWWATHIFSGATASGTFSGDIPAADTGLYFYAWWENGSTASPITAAATLVYCESDQ